MRLKEKTLRLHELLVAPSKEGIDVVGRVHLVELPQHLRLVAPLEGHHRSLQFARVSGKELHVAVPDALFAWGLGLRARLASRARGPEQARQLAQAQSSEAAQEPPPPRAVPHSPPF